MKRFKLNKPMVESPTPPNDPNVYWVDVDENNGEITSIKTFNQNSGNWEAAMMSGDLLKFNGITYNTDLNAIAIGTKTSATGDDQLVFGRENKSDSTKAEIVGGGNTTYLSSSYRNTYGTSIVAFKVGESKEDLEIYLSKLLGMDFKMIDWRDDIKSIYICPHNTRIDIIFNITNTVMTVGDVILKSATSITENQSIALYTSDANWNVASLNTGAISQSYMDKLKLYYTPAYQNSAKNIRTLDWDGTQWNAGDLTCTAVDGTTISVRDLLERIKNLEASLS